MSADTHPKITDGSRTDRATAWYLLAAAFFALCLAGWLIFRATNDAIAVAGITPLVAVAFSALRHFVRLREKVACREDMFAAIRFKDEQAIARASLFADRVAGNSPRSSEDGALGGLANVLDRLRGRVPT